MGVVEEMETGFEGGKVVQVEPIARTRERVNFRVSQNSQQLSVSTT